MTCQTCLNRRGCIVPEADKAQCLAWQEHLEIEGLGQEPVADATLVNRAFQEQRALVTAMHKKGVLTDGEFEGRLDALGHRPKVRSFERLSRRARIKHTF